jgi:hypothetical protein
VRPEPQTSIEPGFYGVGAVVLAVDVALLGGLAAIDKAKGWDIIDLPWRAWLLLVSPALLLIVLLLAVPLAELSPGRVRNIGARVIGRRARSHRAREREVLGHLALGAAAIAHPLGLAPS